MGDNIYPPSWKDNAYFLVIEELVATPDDRQTPQMDERAEHVADQLTETSIRIRLERAGFNWQLKNKNSLVVEGILVAAFDEMREIGAQLKTNRITTNETAIDSKDQSIWT